MGIVNPVDLDKKLFRMSIGPFGTEALVWANHLEEAFEEFVDWLDDTDKAGFFSNVTEEKLRESAASLGLEWKKSWPDYGDLEFSRVTERAEEGLTLLGWTTFKHGQWLNEEWRGDEVTDPSEFMEAYKISAREYYHQYGEVPKGYGRKTSKRRTTVNQQATSVSGM